MNAVSVERITHRILYLTKPKYGDVDGSMHRGITFELIWPMVVMPRGLNLTRTPHKRCRSTESIDGPTFFGA